MIKKTIKNAAEKLVANAKDDGLATIVAISNKETGETIRSVGGNLDEIIVLLGIMTASIADSADVSVNHLLHDVKKIARIAEREMGKE